MGNRALDRRAGPGLDFIDLPGSACRDVPDLKVRSEPDRSGRSDGLLSGSGLDLKSRTAPAHPAHLVHRIADLPGSAWSASYRR